MDWKKRSAKYQSLKGELDSCISSAAKIMGGGTSLDWGSQLKGMAQIKPEIEGVVSKIADAERLRDISSEEAAELRLSLHERMKQYGITIQPN